MPLLAQAGYEVTALDLPGHGFADKPADFDYAGPAMAELITDYLERSGPASVVGTSLGGFVAALVALDNPSLVTELILVGVTGIVPRQTDTSRANSDRSPSGVRRKLEQLLVNHALIDDTWVKEESLINTSPGAEHALDALTAYLTGRISDDLIGERLAAIGCPLMLVWGEEDAWIPLSVGDRVAQVIPSAPYVVLRQCGHGPYLERPEDFSRVVAEFLDPDTRPPAGRRLI
jgi:2-hydroxy-6-oxonona-2,4-dienedioate hydrolase